MRGRKPTPTFLKLVTGNPGHRALNLAEPVPDGDLVDPPEWFSARQRVIWQQCIANAPKGMLRRLDSGALMIYVVASSIHEEAATRVAQFGAIVKSKRRGEQRNPFLSVLDKQALIMLRAMNDLGFNPVARTRVKVTGGKKTQSAFGKLKELKLD